MFQAIPRHCLPGGVRILTRQSLFGLECLVVRNHELQHPTVAQDGDKTAGNIGRQLSSIARSGSFETADLLSLVSKHNRHNRTIFLSLPYRLQWSACAQQSMRLSNTFPFAKVVQFHSVSSFQVGAFWVPSCRPWQTQPSSNRFVGCAGSLSHRSVGPLLY